MFDVVTDLPGCGWQAQTFTEEEARHIAVVRSEQAGYSQSFVYVMEDGERVGHAREGVWRPGLDQVGRVIARIQTFRAVNQHRRRQVA